MEDITRYAGSDLLCYRADGPEGLVENQRLRWDPILDWAEQTLGHPFELVEGIMHTAQPKATIAAYSQRLANFQDAFKLTALHTFTSISGSAVIALALAEGHLDAEQAWTAAHVDEDWNISLWGEDYEAAERRKQKRNRLRSRSQTIPGSKLDDPCQSLRFCQYFHLDICRLGCWRCLHPVGLFVRTWRTRQRVDRCWHWWHDRLPDLRI